MNEQEKQNRQFLSQRVNPIVEKMIVDVMVTRPENITQFMIKWLQEKGEKIESQLGSRSPQKKPSEIQEEENDEVAGELLPKEQIIKARSGRNSRQSVSAEAYGAWNKKMEFKPKVIPKAEDQKARIKQRLSQAFMFSALDEKEQEIVVLAMEEKKFAKGTTIIKQGDEGDVLYVVDTGELACYRKPKKDAEDVFLKKYHAGEAFGELALLYNAPRAATIIADTDAVCFALDRETFNHIVKDAASRKRELYEHFLSKVDILSSMDPYERSQIADALKPAKYSAGQYIVKEGEKGDSFYIIEEGEAEAHKSKADGSTDKVYDYKTGDYFGEISLIKDTPRQASIVAKTDLKLITLDRGSFKRLLGPLEDILKRNFSRYEKYIAI